MNLDSLVDDIKKGCSSNREFNIGLYNLSFFLTATLPYVGVCTETDDILQLTGCGDIKFTVPETIGDDIYICTFVPTKGENGKYDFNYKIDIVDDSEDMKINTKEDLVTLVKFINRQMTALIIYTTNDKYLDYPKEDVEKMIDVLSNRQGLFNTRYLCKVRKGEVFTKELRDKMVIKYGESIKAFISSYIEKLNNVIEDNENPYEEV